MARVDKIHLRPAIWQSDNQTKSTKDLDGGIRRRGVNGYNWNSFFPHPSSSHKDGLGIREASWVRKVKIRHKTGRSWGEFVIRDVLIWHFRRNFWIDIFQTIFFILRKRKWTEPKRILRYWNIHDESGATYHDESKIKYDFIAGLGLHHN